MPTYTLGKLYVTFSEPTKDSSGNATINATFYNNGTTQSNVRLSLSLTNSAPWTQINVGTIQAGGSASGSRTIACGSPTSNTTIYGYFLFGSLTSGNGGSFTAYAYSPPEPEFEKKILSISPTTQTMGNKLSISDSSGYGVTSTTHTWSAGGTTGSFSTGQWTIPISSFEPLCPNASYINATFTTYSSGSGGSGSSSKQIRLDVPSNYVPTATHDYEYLNPRNNGLVAGTSSLKITMYPDVTPADNSATISSCTLLSVNPVPTTDTIPITTSNFTKNGNVFTSSIFPTKSGVPSYAFNLTFRIIDSRGIPLDYTTGSFRVTNFIPPYVSITNLQRKTATTGKLNLTIDSPSSAYLATVKVGNGSAVDVLSQLVATQTGYTLDYDITGLTSGNQYNVTFTYQDTNMHNYGESPYPYTQLLSTLAMPLSLYDDGTNMYVSFGEECADNYGQDVVINFAKDAYLRYANGNNVVIKKVEQAFCPYNVGDIYITTLSSNPSTIWYGTTWSQIEDTFLLSAGSTYTAGDTGGEAEHELSVEEMPSHTHAQYSPNWIKRGSDSLDKGVGDNMCSTGTYNTLATGGGQAHNNMPPYLVVYMWERIS